MSIETTATTAPCVPPGKAVSTDENFCNWSDGESNPDLLNAIQKKAIRSALEGHLTFTGNQPVSISINTAHAVRGEYLSRLIATGVFATLEPAETGVLMALLFGVRADRISDSGNPLVRASNDRLCRRSGFKRSGVFAALSMLRAKGDAPKHAPLIRSAAGGGRGIRTEFELLPPVADGSDNGETDPVALDAEAAEFARRNEETVHHRGQDNVASDDKARATVDLHEKPSSLNSPPPWTESTPARAFVVQNNAKARAAVDSKSRLSTSNSNDLTDLTDVTESNQISTAREEADRASIELHRPRLKSAGVTDGRIVAMLRHPEFLGRIEKGYAAVAWYVRKRIHHNPAKLLFSAVMKGHISAPDLDAAPESVSEREKIAGSRRADAVAWRAEVSRTLKELRPEQLSELIEQTIRSEPDYRKQCLFERHRETPFSCFEFGEVLYRRLMADLPDEVTP